MKTLNTFTLGALLLVFSISYSSCGPDNDIGCENQYVIENTYTGDVVITSGGEDPAADFEGNNDSGIYSFEWCNPQGRASLNFDITTTGGGSVKFILKDHEGEIVLDKTRPNGGNDTFSGVSDNGIAGTWTVEITFMQVNGDGSWSIHPGN